MLVPVPGQPEVRRHFFFGQRVQVVHLVGRVGRLREHEARPIRKVAPGINVISITIFANFRRFSAIFDNFCQFLQFSLVFGDFRHYSSKNLASFFKNHMIQFFF
jgi:hypothetical protein